MRKNGRRELTLEASELDDRDCIPNPHSSATPSQFDQNFPSHDVDVEVALESFRLVREAFEVSLNIQTLR